MKMWWYALGAVAVLGIITASSYNNLVYYDENVSAKIGTLQAQEQRRFDLIPNLVKTVEASSNYERGVLNEVTEARTRMGELLKLNPQELSHSPALEKKFLEAQQQMSSAVSRFMVSVEAYPSLKATEGFLTLQAQLEGTENRIAVARKDIQEAARSYNSSRRSWPFGQLAAFLGGFQERPYLQISTEAQAVPAVQFNLQTSK